MASTDSVEYAKIALSGLGDHTPLKPSELGGRERTAFFSHASVAEATADTINLTVLPAGARVVGMRFCCNDMSTAGAATLTIGDVGDPDRLVLAFDVGTAAIAERNDGAVFLGLRTPSLITPDVGFGYTYAAETIITSTVAVAALTVGLMFGTITYVVD